MRLLCGGVQCVRWGSLLRSVGLGVCYYCVIGNQCRAPEKIKALYAFYWFLRRNLVNRRATPQHTASGQGCVPCVCVFGGVGRHGAMMSGENNTINHRSWNISLSFFPPRSWTVLMIRVGRHLHRGRFPHHIRNGRESRAGYWSSPTASHFDCCYQKLNNGGGK